MTAPARELVPLPNKDLWRGRALDPEPTTPTPVQQVAEVAQPHPLDKAVAACLTFSAGAPQTTCVWCGLQFNVITQLRDHLKANHKSIVEPAVDAAVALADAQIARDELAAERAKE